MERDFLGLTKAAPITVKEKSTDGSKDSVRMRGSRMEWSFSNKVSAIPQFLSFKPRPEEKSKRPVHDPIASPGYIAVSTPEAFDPNQRSFPDVVQKNTSPDKQGGNHYTIKTYPAQHFGGYPFHRPQEMRIFPASNQQYQAINVSMASPVPQSHFSSVGHTVVGSSINSQPLGGVSIVGPVAPVPAATSVIGTTNLRDSSKSSSAPAQLTIFYAGSVCVYDDVSPEKAQAIMFLAGNGCSTTQNKHPSPTQAQTPVLGPSVADGYARNKIITPSPCSGLASPISVSSSSTSDLATVKPAGGLTSSSHQAEPSKTVNSVRPASANLVPAGAVPQARKASLARFLEKRKERAMNTSPYNASKKSSDITSHGPDDGVSLSINSSTSFPQLASN